jgi:pantoate--beta-alanine ligase
MEADVRALESVGCNLVFAPDEGELYPVPQGYKVHPPAELANILEGHFRPGFFVGVATVVHKLFNIVQPRLAVFGKKDYQQLMVIRRMVAQMGLPIEVVGGETLRSAEGLALSSRNGYLSDAERTEALALIGLLRGIQSQARGAAQLTPELISQWEQAAMDGLRSRGWAPDYVMVRRQKDLHPASAEDLARGLVATPLVTLVAAKLGTTRLIDNLEV